MLYLQTAASPAMVTMLLGCVLGAGFMVRFLIALTLDARQTYSERTVRPGGVHYAAEVPRTQTPYRDAVANSASHLAIGVVRITTALASNGGHRHKAAVDRLHVVTLGRPGQGPDFTAERRYRSG
ncbi:MAG: hypothetical protein ACXVZH_06885 [Terriglobales bacterium]